jgi:hypothetical protein
MLLDFGLFGRRHSPSRSRESCSFVARTPHGTLNWSHTGSQFVFNALTNSMTTCQLFTLTKSALILQRDCWRRQGQDPNPQEKARASKHLAQVEGKVASLHTGEKNSKCFAQACTRNATDISFRRQTAIGCLSAEFGICRRKFNRVSVGGISADRYQSGICRRNLRPTATNCDRPTWSDPADGRNKSGQFFLSVPFSPFRVASSRSNSDAPAASKP